MCGTDLHILAGDYASRPPVTLGPRDRRSRRCGRRRRGSGVDRGAGRPRDGVRDLRPLRLVPDGPADALPRPTVGRLGGRWRVRGGRGRAGGQAASTPRLAGRPCRRPAGATRLRLQLPVRPGRRSRPGTWSWSPDRVRSACWPPSSPGSPAAARCVVGTAGDRERLAVAGRLGFETRVVDDPSDRARLDEDAAERRIDVVVEASGAPPAVRSALTWLRPRGTLVQMGLLSGDISVPFGEIVTRELRVRAGFGSSPASWLRAVRLVRERQVELDPLDQRRAAAAVVVHGPRGVRAPGRPQDGLRPPSRLISSRRAGPSRRSGR